MARSKADKCTPVETLKHKDKRTNIPTEELRDFVAQDEADALELLAESGASPSKSAMRTSTLCGMSWMKRLVAQIPDAYLQNPREKAVTHSQGPARIGVRSWARDIGPRNILLDNYPLVPYNALGSFLDP